MPGLDIGWRQPAPISSVLEALALSLAPGKAPDPAPAWLRPDQRQAFTRLLFAVRRHDGALLAEPAGSGKTWIALAVAGAMAGGAACVVPAAAGDHWIRIARRTRVPITITTHEGWSRRPRPLGGGLVIIDESHRFRNRDTARSRQLAPELVGRAGLLLTATPLVNRLSELAAQLRLLVRDDTLAGLGTPSLEETLAAGRVPLALSELVIGGTTGQEALPGSTTRVVRWKAGHWTDHLSRQIHGLKLSPDPGVRGLLLTAFLAAVASSPGALLAMADRYRLLLAHHSDGLVTGRGLNRRTIRRLSPALAQTVLWDLLCPVHAPVDLVPADLPAVDALASTARRAVRSQDPKLNLLTDCLRDTSPAIVFTSFAETVHYLRARLSPVSRTAWCTGTRAGIGRTTLTRARVLDWFRPGGAVGPSDLVPRVLVTTDVAGESIDLHRAGQVIHYDLPWTDMRLEQRAGRIRRRGQLRAVVDVVQLVPPARLERSLDQRGILARKRRLPGLLALDGSSTHPWLVRGRLCRTSGVTPREGTAWTTVKGFRALAGLAVSIGGEPEWPLLLVQRPDGHWCDDLETVALVFDTVRRGAPAVPSERLLQRVLTSLDAHLAGWRRALASALWGGRPRTATLRRAMRAAGRATMRGARERDQALLAAGDRGRRFLGRGHTLGEATLVERLPGLEPSQWPGLLPAEQRNPPGPPIGLRLRGLVLSSSFPECHVSAPSCSTSTAPSPTRSG